MRYEVLINGERIDLSSKSITFEYNSNVFGGFKGVTDVKSYTINVPKTRNNDRIFNSILLPTHKDNGAIDVARQEISCIVIADGIQIIRNGRAYVLSVTENGYDICVKYGIGDKFKEFDDMNLQKLMKGLTASFVRFDTKNSFTDSINTEINELKSKTNCDYVVLDLDRGVSTNTVTPCVSVNSMLDKLSSMLGYSYAKNPFRNVKGEIEDYYIPLLNLDRKNALFPPTKTFSADKAEVRYLIPDSVKTSYIVRTPGDINFGNYLESTDGSKMSNYALFKKSAFNDCNYLQYGQTSVSGYDSNEYAGSLVSSVNGELDMTTFFVYPSGIYRYAFWEVWIIDSTTGEDLWHEAFTNVRHEEVYDKHLGRVRVKAGHEIKIQVSTIKLEGDYNDTIFNGLVTKGDAFFKPADANKITYYAYKPEDNFVIDDANLCLPDINVIDFVSNLCTFMGWFATYDKNNDLVLYSFRDILGKRIYNENENYKSLWLKVGEGVYDWSDKALINRQENDSNSTFVLENTYRNNYVRYGNTIPEEDIQGDFSEKQDEYELSKCIGQFEISNVQLEKKGDFISTEINYPLQSEMKISSIDIAKIRSYNDTKDNDEGEYNSVDGLYIVKTTTAPNGNPVASRTDSMQYRLDSTAYAIHFLKRVVQNNPVVVTMKFRLNANDINQLDLSNLIYLRQFGSYFLIKTITTGDKNINDIELIKL